MQITAVASLSCSSCARFQLTAKAADFKGADLARILGGLGASGAVQPVLVKALCKALAGRSGIYPSNGLAQFEWFQWLSQQVLLELVYDVWSADYETSLSVLQDEMSRQVS